MTLTWVTSVGRTVRAPEVKASEASSFKAACRFSWSTGCLSLTCQCGESTWTSLFWVLPGLHSCQHTSSANLFLSGNTAVQFLGNRSGSFRLVLSIFPPQSLEDDSNSGRLEKYTGVLYVLLYLPFLDLTLGLAGLAFVAYWGIVLFGYDTCVAVKLFIAGFDAFFTLSAVSGTLGSSNMRF